MTFTSLLPKATAFTLAASALTAAAAAQANDDCSGALPLDPAGETVAFDTSAATESPAGVPDLTCSPGPYLDVWYTVTPMADGNITLDTEGSSYDTNLAVYEGGCMSLTEIACDDDSGTGLLSSITFPGVASTTYYVRVAGWQGSNGAGQITISPPPPSVPNDECDGALEINPGTPVFFDTTTATASMPGFDASCSPFSGATLTSNDLWFKFTAAADYSATVSLCGSGYDTKIAVYDGTCAALNLIDCNDDACSLQSEVTIPVVSGVEYIVHVGGYNTTSAGAGQLFVSPPTPDVANDFCVDRIPVGLGSTVYDTTLSTSDGPAATCGAFGSPGNVFNVWFSFTPSADGMYVVDTLGSAYDTTLVGYTGVCGDLTEVACDDDFFGAPDFLSKMIIDATAGTEYIISASGWNASNGAGVLNIELADDPGIADFICSGNPNSTGLTGTLRAEGSLTAADNDLTLVAACMPQAVNALLANSVAAPVAPFSPMGSEGTLCIGSFEMGRSMVMDSGYGGTIDFVVDTTSIPNQAGFVAAMAGETIWWQVFYRDTDLGGAPTSNFTGAVSTTFQ